jgi:hypothetical protein
MMVLVDTTVWIDFFAGRELPHATVLKRLIKDREDDIMLLHNDRDFPPIEKHLGLKVLTPE